MSLIVELRTLNGREIKLLYSTLKNENTYYDSFGTDNNLL